MRNIYLILLVLICLLPMHLWGQDSSYPQDKKGTKSAVKKLSKSLETSKSDDEIAADYMTLAKGLYAQEEYQKAENYFLQAVNLYARSKNKESQSAAYRELARTQEALQKFDAAITSYTQASNATQQKEFKEINTNDANRLRSRNNPASQSGYIQRNIDISNTVQNKDAAAEAYKQMAQTKLDMDDKEGARTEYKNALTNVKDKPEEVMRIQQEIAKTYAAEDEFEKAIGINELLLTEAKKTSNPQIEVRQLQNLSEVYFEAKETTKGMSALLEAYNLAIRSAQTIEAKKILQILASHYRETKNSTGALNVYADFISKLDTLIQSDSTLIDAKFFQLHEQRITQLENERALKDQLIAKTNRFNYVLLGSICLILVFLALIARALYSISKKNKRIALQSLRREMNPHFIFNSLNSVNQFIAQNNELEANKYLSSYSRLMRNMMENSNKDFITLATETEQLKEYLELEHMRFHDTFTYKINMDNTLDMDAVYVPNMIIQPQVENAIWHGLRYKESGGLLTLNIERYTYTDRKEEMIRVTIDDNGIGLKQSQELKTKHQMQHHSRGLTNTRERIQLLNKLYCCQISMEITEKTGKGESGVVVTLKFPLIDKTNEYITEDKKRNR